MHQELISCAFVLIETLSNDTMHAIIKHKIFTHYIYIEKYYRIQLYFIVAISLQPMTHLSRSLIRTISSFRMQIRQPLKLKPQVVNFIL